MFDCIVIGAGPAGITAAIYLLRSNFSVCIIDSGDTALKKAHKIENYYGISSVSGEELYLIGRRQALQLGAEIIDGQALSVDNFGSFNVTTTEGELSSRCVIIATGSTVKGIKLSGEEKFIGSGVSRCAVCDGFFFRGKPVCVVGAGQYALHEAEVLSNICSSVMLLTNGEQPPENCPYPVLTSEISEITGDDRVSGVKLKNGEILDVKGVFIANGKPTASDFILRMGIECSDGVFAVNEDMSTAINGVFAAGDCVKQPKQISTAAYTGMIAGLSAIKYIKEIKKNG